MLISVTVSNLLYIFVTNVTLPFLPEHALNHVPLGNHCCHQPHARQLGQGHFHRNRALDENIFNIHSSYNQNIEKTVWGCLSVSPSVRNFRLNAPHGVRSHRYFSVYFALSFALLFALLFAIRKNLRFVLR